MKFAGKNQAVEIQEAILTLPLFGLLALIFRKKRLMEKEKEPAPNALRQPTKANRIFLKIPRVIGGFLNFLFIFYFGR